MPDTLQTDQRLNSGDQLVSPSGRFHLWMQSDGNLVLYDGPPTVRGAYWATNTWTLPPGQRPTFALMQSDGHLVLYNDSMVPAWGSGVFGPNFVRPYLRLQDDGNLVIYEGNENPIWASNTVRSAPPSTLPIRLTESADVGWGKRMTTTATLYRNGSLTVESEQRNDNWFGGLRGDPRSLCRRPGAKHLDLTSPSVSDSLFRSRPQLRQLRDSEFHGKVSRCHW